jgi:hypothetical protein
MNPQPPRNPQFTFTLPAPAASPPHPRPSRSAVLWLIALGLLANAAVLATRGRAPDITFDRAALAQATPSQTGQLLGARGIYMMPAQLGPMTFGLYLMDVDSGTICVYRAQPDGNRFTLMASRSFKYDRFLEDFNNDKPRPKDVQNLIEAQKQRDDLRSKDDQPTVDQAPKPSENLPEAPKLGLPN